MCFSDYKNLIDLLDDIFIYFRAANFEDIVELKYDQKSFKPLDIILDEFGKFFSKIFYFYEYKFTES